MQAFNSSFPSPDPGVATYQRPIVDAARAFHLKHDREDRALARFQLKRAAGGSQSTRRIHPIDSLAFALQRQSAAFGDYRAYRARRMSDIVVYEENDLMRALLQEWLSGAGYCVHAAASHALADQRPADLVIISMYMPKHAGAQLVREIRAKHPCTPLIAISGQFRSGLSANGVIARTLGVHQVIAKPLTRTDLLDAVRAIIGPPG
jgi:CheY-like chemotaxis protein